MNYNVNKQTKKTASVRRLFAAALVFGCAFGTATNAAAQNITPPTTPTLITPPAGNSAFLLGHGVGTQGYVCLPTRHGRFLDRQRRSPRSHPFYDYLRAGHPDHHAFPQPRYKPQPVRPKPAPFGNATWQSSLDSSKVWAQTVHSIAAGSDASCPNAGAIGCLLLQSIGSQQGPTGGKAMTQTTFIQRLNTKGGSAPADGCLVASDVGKQTLVPYTADYYFFHGGK